jgi:beta-N-acetylhexosaminidase
VRGAGGALKNTVSIDNATGSLLTEILDRAAKRTVVLAMGNPYLVQDFPAIENYVCAFSNATVSETAAVKAIFGEIPISGHLPVTIPGVASRGQGLERPARPASSPSGSGGSSDVQSDVRSNVRSDAQYNLSSDFQSNLQLNVQNIQP